MKTNYTLKATLMFIILTLGLTNLSAQENVRIFKLDPATNSVTLKNFGDANATISGYWFCNRPSYAPVNGMTSVVTLSPNEEINLASPVNFPVSSGEFGLYSSSGFGSSDAMLDYIQWGTGNSGSSRESVAVAAGLWVADTFVTASPPFQYGGDGTQNGVANWNTLGLDYFEQENNLKLYPNPTTTTLNIEIQNTISNGTLEVYDVLGKQIFNQTISSNNTLQIDVANWNTGLFLIKISSDNKIITKRFIKN
tara:strand:+ start:412 stop:1167 length:756 start_codon:yes stop_codon:yes gene_type:complete